MRLSSSRTADPVSEALEPEPRPATPAGPPGSASTGGWYRYVLESLLLVGLLVCADHLFFDGNRFSNINPRPFWIPVLLMSVQYGLAGGVFAAFASTLALYSGALPSQLATQDYYAYSRLIVAEPTSWLACALVLGGLSSLQLAHAAEVRRQRDEAQAAAEDLGHGLQQALSDLGRLELQIAAETRTAGAIARAFAGLEPGGPERLAASFAAFARLVVGASDLTVYAPRGGAWVAVGHAGEARDAPRLARLEPDTLQALGHGPDQASASPRLLAAGASPLWPDGAILVPVVPQSGADASALIVVEGCPSGQSAAAARRAQDVALGLGGLLKHGATGEHGAR
ncbi:hypothetical protein VQ03_29210 [Methylobacterium tarhaniae]|uniref:GAF domain-containing protein n=1 Tax=Methylobacterium tarhaniae TaxID=1187852 RepID=A0A0J6S7I3_9HYPH|nr:hypothetical protein [Methylobacterium tarhaniae]KMO29592.1 hypothetical protein VQ03_29210 [Methylobacterium tarhaniae]